MVAGGERSRLLFWEESLEGGAEHIGQESHPGAQQDGELKVILCTVDELAGNELHRLVENDDRNGHL